jgi:hypothetical protein
MFSPTKKAEGDFMDSNVKFISPEYRLLFSVRLGRLNELVEMSFNQKVPDHVIATEVELLAKCFSRDVNFSTDLLSHIN